MKWLALPVLFISSVTFSFSQIFSSNQFLGKNNRGLPVGVPFLLVSPDPRAASMGETGAATSCDEFSTFHNASKLAFYLDKTSFGICYTPWLRALVPDLNYVYLSYVNKLNKHSAISTSLAYFSYGPPLNPGSQFKPNEFAVDVSYARKLTDHFSVAMAGRYIYSDLFGANSIYGPNAHTGKAIAVDISAFKSDSTLLNEKLAIFSFGINISNIGNHQVSYFNYPSVPRLFLPTNLKFGTCTKLAYSDKSEIAISVDLNKLLVPTPI